MKYAARGSLKNTGRKISPTRMWADAQRDGGALRESSVIPFPCTTPQSLTDARCWSAVQ